MARRVPRNKVASRLQTAITPASSNKSRTRSSPAVPRQLVSGDEMAASAQKTTMRENAKGHRERRLTLWLAEDLVRRFKVACAELDLPMNAITSEVLEQWLAQHEQNGSFPQSLRRP